MPASDYLVNSWLDTLSNTSFAVTTAYIALSTTAPNADGTNVSEPGDTYARQSIAWNAAASRAKDNSGEIAFPEATASWGTVTHFAIYDAASGGNMLWYGTLTDARAIGAGDTPRFLAETFELSFS